MTVWVLVGVVLLGWLALASVVGRGVGGMITVRDRQRRTIQVPDLESIARS